MTTGSAADLCQHGPERLESVRRTGHGMLVESASVREKVVSMRGKGSARHDYRHNDRQMLILLDRTNERVCERSASDARFGSE